MITQIEERYRWSSPTKMIHILVSLITCLFATLLILILNVPICYISSQSSNKDKNEALKPLNILILGKGMMDLVSRVLIFFIFMIVLLHDGRHHDHLQYCLQREAKFQFLQLLAR